MKNRRHPPASYARILFRHLRLGEKNCQGYFAGTQLSYEKLMTLDETITHDDLTQIYRNALALSKVENLGLSVGTQLHLPTHGPLGVATFSAPDLRTALTLLGKYGQTRVNFFNTSVSEHPQGLKIHFAETFDLDDLRLFMTEAVLSGLFSAIDFFVGANQFNGHVYFSYPKPSYWQQYHDYFGDNIQFDHAATEIIVSSSILSIPSPVADADMHKEAVAICEQQLKEITVNEEQDPVLPIEQAVSTMIAENPGRIWTLDEVAAKLSMSPRTLIRKLSAEGTRFQAIRDQQAKKQVATYLTDASLSVESIGYLMGFSDVSSFRRSFKRWFRETPSQYMTRTRATQE